MIVMNPVAAITDKRRQLPVATSMPVMNSAIERLIAHVSVTSRDASTDQTFRYSSSLYIKPHGSTNFDHPEIIKVAPTMIRASQTLPYFKSMVLYLGIFGQFDNTEYRIVDHIHIVGIDSFRHKSLSTMIFNLFRALNLHEYKVCV